MIRNISEEAFYDSGLFDGVSRNCIGDTDSRVIVWLSIRGRIF